MTNREVATALRRLINEERFDEAARLLPEYAGAVMRECSHADDVLRARDFLRAVAQSVKARRAHYSHELSDTALRRAYLRCETVLPSIDCDG